MSVSNQQGLSNSGNWDVLSFQNLFTGKKSEISIASLDTPGESQYRIAALLFDWIPAHKDPFAASFLGEGPNPGGFWQRKGWASKVSFLSKEGKSFDLEADTLEQTTETFEKIKELSSKSKISIDSNNGVALIKEKH